MIKLNTNDINQLFSYILISLHYFGIKRKNTNSSMDFTLNFFSKSAFIKFVANSISFFIW